MYGTTTSSCGSIESTRQAQHVGATATAAAASAPPRRPRRTTSGSVTSMSSNNNDNSSNHSRQSLTIANTCQDAKTNLQTATSSAPTTMSSSTSAAASTAAAAGGVVGTSANGSRLLVKRRASCDYDAAAASNSMAALRASNALQRSLSSSQILPQAQAPQQQSSQQAQSQPTTVLPRSCLRTSSILKQQPGNNNNNNNASFSSSSTTASTRIRRYSGTNASIERRRRRSSNGNSINSREGDSSQENGRNGVAGVAVTTTSSTTADKRGDGLGDGEAVLVNPSCPRGQSSPASMTCGGSSSYGMPMPYNDSQPRNHHDDEEEEDDDDQEEEEEDEDHPQFSRERDIHEEHNPAAGKDLDVSMSSIPNSTATPTPAATTSAAIPSQRPQQQQHISPLAPASSTGHSTPSCHRQTLQPARRKVFTLHDSSSNGLMDNSMNMWLRAASASMVSLTLTDLQRSVSNGIVDNNNNGGGTTATTSHLPNQPASLLSPPMAPRRSLLGTMPTTSTTTTAGTNTAVASSYVPTPMSSLQPHATAAADLTTVSEQSFTIQQLQNQPSIGHLPAAAAAALLAAQILPPTAASLHSVASATTTATTPMTPPVMTWPTHFDVDVPRESSDCCPSDSHGNGNSSNGSSHYLSNIVRGDTESLNGSMSQHRRRPRQQAQQESGTTSGGDTGAGAHTTNSNSSSSSCCSLSKEQRAWAGIEDVLDDTQSLGSDSVDTKDVLPADIIEAMGTASFNSNCSSIAAAILQQKQQRKLQRQRRKRNGGGGTGIASSHHSFSSLMSKEMQIPEEEGSVSITDLQDDIDDEEEEDEEAYNQNLKALCGLGGNSNHLMSPLSTLRNSSKNKRRIAGAEAAASSSSTERGGGGTGMADMPSLMDSSFSSVMTENSVLSILSFVSMQNDGRNLIVQEAVADGPLKDFLNCMTAALERKQLQGPLNQLDAAASAAGGSITNDQQQLQQSAMLNASFAASATGLNARSSVRGDQSTAANSSVLSKGHGPSIKLFNVFTWSSKENKDKLKEKTKKPKQYVDHTAASAKEDLHNELLMTPHAAYFAAQRLSNAFFGGMAQQQQKRSAEQYHDGNNSMPSLATIQESDIGTDSMRSNSKSLSDLNYDPRELVTPGWDQPPPLEEYDEDGEDDLTGIDEAGEEEEEALHQEHPPPPPPPVPPAPPKAQKPQKTTAAGAAATPKKKVMAKKPTAPASTTKVAPSPASRPTDGAPKKKPVQNTQKVMVRKNKVPAAGTTDAASHPSTGKPPRPGGPAGASAAGKPPTGPKKVKKVLKKKQPAAAPAATATTAAAAATATSAPPSPKKTSLDALDEFYKNGDDQEVINVAPTAGAKGIVGSILGGGGLHNSSSSINNKIKLTKYKDYKISPLQTIRKRLPTALAFFGGKGRRGSPTSILDTGNCESRLFPDFSDAEEEEWGVLLASSGEK